MITRQRETSQNNTSPSVTALDRGRFDRGYDAVVVGARTAGAATAMLLARQGLRVLAIDQQSYGSDALSSHALMRGAVDRLHSWGVLPAIWEAQTPVIRRTNFRYGTEELSLDIKPAPGRPGLAAPRRTILDRAVVDAARDAGAAVVHDTRLCSVNKDTSGRVIGVDVQGPHSPTVSIEADIVIGADGLRSTVARQLSVPVTQQGRNASAYIMRYYRGVRGVDPEAFGWLYGRDMGAGIIPTNDDTFCVFTAMPRDRFAAEARGAVEAAHVRTLRALDPKLAEYIAGATPIGPLRSWPGVPGQFRKAFGPGWALVGDAGYFKDPFAAHGITDAFRDAELLSAAAMTGDFAGYESARNELSQPLFDTLEKIAGYEWDLQTLPGLHYQLSKAMRDEDARTLAPVTATAA